MTANDFVTYFSDVFVGYFIDTYVNNYLEVTGLSLSDTSAHTYTFTIPSSGVQTTWVGVDFYNPRMYP